MPQVVYSLEYESSSPGVNAGENDGKTAESANGKKAESARNCNGKVARRLCYLPLAANERVTSKIIDAQRRIISPTKMRARTAPKITDMRLSLYPPTPPPSRPNCRDAPISVQRWCDWLDWRFYTDAALPLSACSLTDRPPPPSLLMLPGPRALGVPLWSRQELRWEHAFAAMGPSRRGIPLIGPGLPSRHALRHRRLGLEPLVLGDALADHVPGHALRA